MIIKRLKVLSLRTFTNSIRTLNSDQSKLLINVNNTTNSFNALTSITKFKYELPTKEDSRLVLKSVYIGNLPYTFNENSFKQFFSKFGNIVESKLVYDQLKRFNGAGFVQIDRTEYKEFIKKTNKMKVEGRIIHVNLAKVQKSDWHIPKIEYVANKYQVPTKPLSLDQTQE